MNHKIDVSFIGSQVSATPNPSPGSGNFVKPGETVTWRFDEAKDLQVVFREFVDLAADGSVIETTRKPSNPLGPLSGLSLGAGLLIGTIRSDVPQGTPSRRFIYKLVQDGIDLQWAAPVPGGSATNGGGIDIPSTPP